YAGRIQLIASILASMQMYWASVYLLPAIVINDLEELFKRFLCNARDLAKGKARVSWKVVYTPKDQGGLGIKSLKNGMKFY
nr:reverse transcriptase domain, reverse transcriptase zinc-binding domain protein [Tanacetum cinerariifolium]